MITVPLYYASAFTTNPSLPVAMIVTYSYIPESALGENGLNNQTIAPVQYSYSGDIEYVHGSLTIESSFDPVDFLPFERDISYPDDWLELRISIRVYQAVESGVVSHHAFLNDLHETYYNNGGIPGNFYTVPEENEYSFRSFVTQNGTYIDPTAIPAIVTYWDSFAPFTFRYEFGDGTEETHEAPITRIIGSPATRLFCDFTIPEPKEYAPGVHIDYPKVWVENAHGQRMRPIYYDLWPTATLDADDSDTDVSFTLDPWDFENELDNYEVWFGDGSTLLNQSFDDLTFSHSYAVEGEYTVTVILRDRNTPNVFIGNHLFRITVNPQSGDHPINALTDPFGCLYGAKQVPNGDSKDIQVFTQRGGATRENLYLLTNHRAPSIYRAGGSQLFLVARDLADGVWRLYLSNDCGETFTLMAEPFGNDSSYKKVRVRGTAEGGGIATALKDGWVYFVHSWDNDTWGTPVAVVESTEPGDVHQQSAAGSARLVIVLPSATYVSNTADGAAGSWELMPE